MRERTGAPLDALASRIARSYQRRGIMLIAATYLFAMVFVVRMVSENADDPIGLFFAVPIALFALALGLGAGLAAPGASLAALVLFDLTHADDIPALGYAARATVFLLLGGLVGATTTQLNLILEQLDPSGRRRDL